MYVKKRMSLLLFAALAMVLFTACGRWDFSREAAKAANEAQNAVVFEASTTLAQSLKDALEDKVQTADVKAAMEADERLADLLGRLDVYAVEGDDAKAAAQTIAEGYIKGRVSGRQSDGHIAMVKADNGWFYAAVVTTTTGGSGSGSGSGGGSGSGSDDGNGGTSGGNQGDDDQTKEEYTVSWSDPTGGDIGVTANNAAINPGDKVEKGTVLTITTEPSTGYELESVTVTEDGTENPLNEGDYSWTVNNNVTIKVTFKQCAIEKIEVTTEPTTTEYIEGQKFDTTGMVVTATYTNGDTITLQASDYEIDLENGTEFTAADAEKGSKMVTVTYTGDAPTVDDKTLTDTFTVSVEALKLEKVELIGYKNINYKKGDHLLYTEGFLWNKNARPGLKLKLIYNNEDENKMIDVTDKMVNDNTLQVGNDSIIGGLQAGDNTLTIVYHDGENFVYSDPFIVTVD